MTEAERFLKANGRMPTMTECEDGGWADGYNEAGELVVTFGDDSTLTDSPDGIAVA